MAVTELALLEYKHASTTSSASSPTSFPPHLLTALHNAISAQASYSHHPVTLLQSHEHPSQLYLLGGWDSVSTHMNDWIPSPTNQELLKTFGDGIDVKWMFHLDCNPDDVVAGFARRVQDEGNVVSIGRHFVKKGRKEEFEACWRGNVDALEGFVVGGMEGRKSGWRVDRGFVAPVDDADGQGGEGNHDNEVNEFVLFAAWAGVEDHTMEFVSTEEFQRYGKIREFIDGAEIRHAKVIDYAEA